jgi:hypothetical protein
MNLFARAKLLILLMTILIVAGCVFTACSTASPNPDSTLEPSMDNGLEVVYFHRTNRCYSCTYAEDKVRYTLDTFYSDELADGELVFMAVNVQDDANSAIIDKYGAYTSSLYMNRVINGVDDIENITGIWFLIGKDQEFIDYVNEEIEERLQ